MDALYAALVALLVPWPLISFTQLPTPIILAIQSAVFAALLLLFSVAPLTTALVPSRVKRRNGFRAATEQFYARGLSRTRHRAGVLIYVSLAEHYARILADEGLNDKIVEAQWRPIVEELVAHLRVGRIADGFVVATQATGALLARAAPPDDGPNELPDRLIVLE
jgi:putative membrane protein